MRTSTRARLRAPDRRGFTLVELLSAIMLMGVVVGLALPFFTSQARFIDRTAGRFDAGQNVRYAANAIERELRMAGVGVTGAQPVIVMAGVDAITFNTDLVTNDSSDIAALYYDREADPATLSVLAPANQILLPGTSWHYPDSLYSFAGSGGTRAPGAAETISFFASADPENPGQYDLWRRVNDADSTLLARGLVLQAGKPLFSYFTVDTTGKPDSIAAARLPIWHRAPIHESAADTGTSHLTDDIRSVRVRLVGMYSDSRQGNILDTATATIRVVNAGLNHRSECGDRPLMSSGVTALVQTDSLGVPTGVVVSWPPALDETGGERDIERYAVYKRDAAGSFADPLVIVPAGQSSYSVLDSDLASGTWVYGVAAQDCTPNTSGISPSNAVTVTIP